MKTLALISLSAVGSFAFATELTLDEAIRLATERNGDVLSATYNIRSAQSGVRQALTDFQPTVTPNFTYDVSRTERYTGSGAGRSDFTGDTFDITARYRLLDSGQRSLNLNAQRLQLTSSELSAVQSVRATIFQVISSYYEALRAQDLLKVQESQLERAEIVLKQTRARIEVGDLPGKDIYQPEADKANALVSVLSAKTRVQTTQASLRANIGWGPSEGALELVPVTLENNYEVPAETMQQAVADGLESRPDLRGRRIQIQNQELNVRLAQISSGIQYSVDANYSRGFSRDVLDRSGVALVVSFPLFDGGLSKEVVNERRANLGASRAQLTQLERDATAEIESAYQTYIQNGERITAADAALKAAQKNYEFVSAAYKEQVATLPELTIAQTSLVTSQVNYVQAIYDLLISENQLQLAIGKPLPGERMIFAAL